MGLIDTVAESIANIGLYEYKRWRDQHLQSKNMEMAALAKNMDQAIADNDVHGIRALAPALIKIAGIKPATIDALENQAMVGATADNIKWMTQKSSQPQGVAELGGQVATPEVFVRRPELTAEQLKEQQNAQWAVNYLTDTARGMKPSASILKNALPPEQGGMGFIPGSVVDGLPEMTESDFNDFFAVSVAQLRNDPAFREAVQKETGNKGEALEGDIFDVAVTMVGLKGGRHPDWADPIISGQRNRDYQLELQKQEDQARLTEKLQREFEASRPISQKDKLTYGIGSGPTAGIQTYDQLSKAGFRFQSEADRKLYDTVGSTLQMVQALRTMSDKLNVSADDYASRGLHGAYLQKEIAMGSELGIIAKDYKDAAEGIPRLLLPLLGEQGGRFTDKDMEQIVKQIPSMGLFPDGKGVAQRKLDRLELLLKKKLETVYAPRIVEMGKGAKATHKVVNGKLVEIKPTGK